MNIDYEAIKKVQEIDIFNGVTEQEIEKGQEIKGGLQEFENPEDRLTEHELFCLSAFCEYQAEIDSREEIPEGEEYIFPEEDEDQP